MTTCFNAAGLLSLSHMIGGLANLSNRPLAGLINRSMARLGSLGLISVDLICNKDIFMSV